VIFTGWTVVYFWVPHSALTLLFGRVEWPPSSESPCWLSTEVPFELVEEQTWRGSQLTDVLLDISVRVVFCMYGNYGKWKERKSIYIAPFWPRRYTQRNQAWITQFCLQITPCLPSFVSVHQMSPPQQLQQQTSNCSLLLIYRPQKDERLSWPSWLTYSGWFTHISGHPSATGWAQDSESTPAKDRCSTAGPRHQLTLMDTKITNTNITDINRKWYVVHL